jgi:hypothetical protein
MRDTLLKRFREDITFPPNFLDQVQSSARM